MIVPRGLPSKSRGAILIIVLVMVGIFMVIVTGMVATSNINFRIAGNQQYQLEAKTAARNSIEAFISNGANFALPLLTSATVFTFNLDGDVDASGNDIDDISASIAPPVCTRSEPIGVNELDPSSADDVQCLGSGAGQNTGIISSGGVSGSGDSWCSRMNWEVESVVDDVNTGAAVSMNQGLFMRAIIGTPCPS